MKDRGSEPDGRTVAIWKDRWLAGSETFVRNHATGLARWSAHCLGFERLESPIASRTDHVLYDREGIGTSVAVRLGRMTGLNGRVIRAIRQSGATVVHAHSASDAMSVRLSARAANVPLVVTLHGVDITAGPRIPGLRGVTYRMKLRALFRDAAVIVCVSEHIARAARANGAPPQKVAVVYNGVQTAQLDTVVHDKWDLIFIGRLVEKKGLLDLLEATRILKGEGRAVKVLVVGDGPLLPDAETMVAQNGLDVTFSGPLSPTDVQARLLEAKVVAVPSKTAQNGDTEGLPTVVLEAMAAGRPVVATKHAGIPEAVKDGHTGILAPEGDPMALAEGLLRLIDDESLRHQMGRAGANRALELFTLERQIAALESIYDEVALAATGSA